MASGLFVEEVKRNARVIERGFALLGDTEDVYREWRKIVVQYGVSGVQAHDARLAAAMHAHGITDILTLNGADFSFCRHHGARSAPDLTPTNPIKFRSLCLFGIIDLTKAIGHHVVILSTLAHIATDSTVDRGAQCRSKSGSIRGSPIGGQDPHKTSEGKRRTCASTNHYSPTR